MVRNSIFALAIVGALTGLILFLQNHPFGSALAATLHCYTSNSTANQVSRPFSPILQTESKAKVGAGLDSAPDSHPVLRATIVPMPTARATQALSVVVHSETKKYITLGDHRVRADIVEIRLSQFPKPKHDNGRGLHWFPTTAQKREVVDRFIPELAALKIRWLVILQGMEEWNFAANDYLVDELNKVGIIPVMRLEMKVGQENRERVERVVAHYRARGVRYFQIFNEPNAQAEWAHGETPTPEEFMRHWIPVAEIVAQHGGLPGLAPLMTSANHADEIFLEKEYQILLREKRYDLINIMWLAIHNYGGMDEQGFLKYKNYARISKFYFRQTIPMLATEGGMGDAQNSAETVVNAFDAMKFREPWFLAYCPWLIGNAVGGGHDETWEAQAWFQRSGPLPIVERVKNLE